MAHDVFISYSANDKPIADAMCSTLESNGLQCWDLALVVCFKNYADAIDSNPEKEEKLNQIGLKHYGSAEARTKANSIFISVANTPQIGTFNNPRLNEETVRTFARLLGTNSHTGLRSKLQYFEAEDHGSVPLLSLHQGLLFIFDGYRPAWAIFLEPPTKIISHFKNVSQRIGVELLPPEQLINSMGYALLYELREVDKAIGLFRLNVSLYPKSFNAYNSLAESYLVKGDKALAVTYYETSLQLNPANQKAKDQLQKLKN